MAFGTAFYAITYFDLQLTFHSFLLATNAFWWEIRLAAATISGSFRQQAANLGSMLEYFSKLGEAIRDC